MFLYFIYDVISRCVVRVLTFQSDEVCLRFLKSAFDVPNSPFLININDTILIKVAHFDNDTLSLSLIDSEFEQVSSSDYSDYKFMLHGKRIDAYYDIIKKHFEFEKKERGNNDESKN